MKLTRDVYNLGVILSQKLYIVFVTLLISNFINFTNIALFIMSIDSNKKNCEQRMNIYFQSY